MTSKIIEIPVEGQDPVRLKVTGAPATPTLAAAIAICAVRIEDAERYLRKWKADRLDKDPAFGLENGDQAFRAAAELEVYARLRAWLTPHHSGVSESPSAVAAMVLQQVRRTISQMARNCEQSTSKTTNLMNRERLRAWQIAIDPDSFGNRLPGILEAIAAQPTA